VNATEQNKAEDLGRTADARPREAARW